MKKPTLYLETTIISYLTAKPSRDVVIAAHQQITQEWWENRRADFYITISQFVIQEAGAGDNEAIQRRMQALEGIPSLPITEEAISLAKLLVNKSALPENALGDALHVAIATTNGADYLMTWNMKHLANAAIRNIITAVCRAHGFEPPVICTPEELLEA